MSPTDLKQLVGKPDLIRVVLGWGTFGLMLLVRPLLGAPVPAPLLIIALIVIIAVILVCAFGVVKQAEALAHRLGDPYGSLVLTLSIVLIEVILISAVMLGPGEHTTIARDSVMAVAMIILNLVVGLALLVGGIRHRGMAHNRTGTSAYLAMLVVLIALAFGLPALIGERGSYTPEQQLPIIVLTLVLYAFFLFRQMGPQTDDFIEVDERDGPLSQNSADTTTEAHSIRHVISEHRTEVIVRLALLVITVIPIVLLSHDMAALLDDGLGRIGAPAALAGILIAAIVFLPESITAIRAALGGEAQRVNNLCHGALVSTVGLTIPAVLVIAMFTGQTVILAESPANLLMLGATLLLSVTTFSAKRVTALHGATHLALFVVYVIVLFS